MECGILSTAGIARTAVLPAIAASEHRVGAIASRNGERAAAVADEFSIPRHYGGYADLIDDGELELGYEIDGQHGTERFDPVDQYRLEVEQFATCVETESQPLTDGAEAIANMRVIDGLYESAARGTPVDLA